MIDIVKFILSRITLITLSVIIIFPVYLFVKNSKKNYKSVEIAENIKVSHPIDEKKIPVTEKKTSQSEKVTTVVNVVNVKKSPSTCELNKYLTAPVFNYIIPLNPDGIIQLSFTPEPSGINPEIKPDTIKADRYHLAGSICLGKALILKSFIETKKWPDKLPFSKPDPGNEEKAFKDYLQCATNWFTALRPVPPYKKWSEAMYLNAWAFSLLGKLEDAKKFLTIPARTQSKSFPAKLSRFVLEIIEAKTGKKTINPSEFKEFKNYSTFINYYNTLFLHKEDSNKHIQTISFEIERFHTINSDVFGSLISELTQTCIPDNNFKVCMKSIINYCKSPLCRSNAFWYAVGFITKLNSKNKSELLSAMCSLKGNF